jgi:hypothetical protein
VSVVFWRIMVHIKGNLLCFIIIFSWDGLWLYWRTLETD